MKNCSLTFPLLMLILLSFFTAKTVKAARPLATDDVVFDSGISFYFLDSDSDFRLTFGLAVGFN